MFNTSALYCLCFRYPDARAIQRKIIFHAGPTNSGKTYHAIQRFLSAKSGIYCGPLKLLAHEIFQKSNDAVSMSYYLPTSLGLEQSHEFMSLKSCSGPRWSLEPCAWAGAFALQWCQLMWVVLSQLCISASGAELNIISPGRTILSPEHVLCNNPCNLLLFFWNLLLPGLARFCS